MSKHTPAPWRAYSREESTRGTRHYVEHSAGNVCEVFREDNPHETRANARLIASAPELLDVLKSLVAGVRDGYVWKFGDCGITDALAAIAKAEGRDA